MNIKFSPPDITEKEIEAVSEVLRSGWITTGPKTKLFEKRIAEYCGTDKAVCMNSATAALELTLKSLGIGEGDEVITSAYTYTASASVIQHVGAKIVLCDVAKDSYGMDYEKLAGLITEKTKAIIPVDVAGKMCNYAKMFEVVQNSKKFSPNNDIQKVFNRIVVIADAAHSFGAKQNGLMSGNVADFTCFSFHAVKNFTTAEGGALTWKSKTGLDNEKLYKDLMLWALHGQNKDALAKTQLGAWEYDIVHLGHKCNMTDIMSAIGLVQLERYSALLERRKQIIILYDKLLSNKIDKLQHFEDTNISCGHLYLTRIKNADEQFRNNTIIKMAEKGIACNVHYKPLPLFTTYKNYGFDITNYPNAFNQYKNEITLPLHTLLTDEEVRYVAETYNSLV